MKHVLTTIGSAVQCFSSITSQRLFSKYRFILMLAVIAMFVSSCRKEDHFCKKTVPFKGKFETLDEGTAGITGTGVATYIGKSTFVAKVDFDNFPLLTGMQTNTAANGDQIFSTFSGSVVGPDDNGTLQVTNNHIITGGTGRFVGATGSFTVHGIANTNVPTGTETFDGSITLDECHENNGSIKKS